MRVLPSLAYLSQEMAETWRYDGSSLDTLSWRVLSLDASNTSAGRDYLVKGVFHEESGYHVMLLESLASAIWEERLDAKEVLLRMKVWIQMQVEIK